MEGVLINWYSENANPVLVVKKGTGETRLYEEYNNILKHKLNNKMIKNTYHILIISRGIGYYIFTSFVLKSLYHQIVRENQHKIALSYP